MEPSNVTTTGTYTSAQTKEFQQEVSTLMDERWGKSTADVNRSLGGSILGAQSALYTARKACRENQSAKFSMSLAGGPDDAQWKLMNETTGTTQASHKWREGSKDTTG
jgi:hypothetical protein